ncbi:hypothetical protein ABWW58_14430 [Sporolactobacillus sp. STCC-11]|uniref:hypothetical protein n=1 Tax=Sporolactobacillus caesalpiniae TaxID=3230362 RepID=UPI0033976364
MKRTFIILMVLFLLTGCGSSKSTRRHLTQNEQVAYNFLKGMYSGNSVKKNHVISKDTTQGKFSPFVSRSFFNQKISDIQFTKAQHGTRTNKNITYALFRLRNSKGTQENVVVVKKRKVLLVYSSAAESNEEKQLFMVMRQSIYKPSVLNHAQTTTHNSALDNRLIDTTNKSYGDAPNEVFIKRPSIQRLGTITPIAYGFSDQLGITGKKHIPIEPIEFGRSKIIITNVALVRIKPNTNGSKLFHTTNPIYAYVMHNQIQNGYAASMTYAPNKITLVTNTGTSTGLANQPQITIAAKGSDDGISIVQAKSGKIPTKAQLELPAPVYQTSIPNAGPGDTMTHVVPIRMQAPNHPVLIGHTY